MRPAHKYDVPPRPRDADARAESGFGSWQLLHRARNCVQSIVKTAARDDNRHPGRGECQSEPWTILINLAPSESGASWNEIRFWIETGFKALKSVGWQWRKTWRTDPARVDRRRRVLSVATPLTLVCDSRVDDAQALKLGPSPRRRKPRLSETVSRARFALAWRR